MAGGSAQAPYLGNKLLDSPTSDDHHTLSPYMSAYFELYRFSFLPCIRGKFNEIISQLILAFVVPY